MKICNGWMRLRLLNSICNYYIFFEFIFVCVLYCSLSRVDNLIRLSFFVLFFLVLKENSEAQSVLIMASLYLFSLILMNSVNSETRSCSKDGTCYCLQDEPCTFECNSVEKCGNSKLYCPPGYSCLIDCRNKDACIGSKFYGNGATNMTLSCSGDTSCKNAELTCNAAG